MGLQGRKRNGGRTKRKNQRQVYVSDSDQEVWAEARTEARRQKTSLSAKIIALLREWLRGGE